VNPYGPPAGITEAALGAIGGIRKHPYEAEAEVGSQYATWLGVDQTELTVGRGTTDFIWRYARARVPRAAVPLPAYTDFLRAFPNCGVAPLPGETPTATIGRCMANADLVMVSNPCNPTGHTIARDELVEVCRRNPMATLVVDESYVDFHPTPGTVTLVGANVPNAVVLRSPSKFWGIAGARVGVAWTRGESNRTVLASPEPWPVSLLDAAVACHALVQAPWAIGQREVLATDGIHLAELLTGTGDGTVAPSQLHFRLWYPSDAGAIADCLLRNGIVVRRLGAAHGLVRDALRITAPRPQDADRLAQALAQLGR
jgi:histidinol-phosphate/aromatic aminotransferase/cobyric acid decarboxylase-like protein